ncbi:MAG: SCO1664 family protein [Candidatus Limnocylindrales bacterium]
MPTPTPKPPKAKPISDRAEALGLLADGEIEVIGRIVGSTNNALFVRVTRPEANSAMEPPTAHATIDAIYKPTIGERPLEDFPDGTLTRRELAAWHVSEAMGWAIVPPTVLREGPFGEGMVQAFVDTDEDVDVVAMVVEDDPRLRRMATFDAAINNTDRKGGHILPVDGGKHVHGVDHGVTFSVVPKLRTVLWGWRGQPLAPDEVGGLERLRDALQGELGMQLRDLLRAREVKATVRRVEALLADGRFPFPSRTWPAVPWPPF